MAGVEVETPQGGEQDKEDAAEIARTVGRLYLGLVGFGFYLIMTLSVEDAMLVRADAEIEIPVFGVGVDLSRILFFAPICLVALAFYLHVFYGQLLGWQRRGVRVSQAYLFTMPNVPARVASLLILYAFLPLVLAWTSWKALFRPEAPFLVGLTIATAAALALAHYHRVHAAPHPEPEIARLGIASLAGLVLVFAGYTSWVGWQGLIENRALDLVGADLSRADLRRVNLRNLNLSQARLDGADLFDADLRGANLRGAVLREAQLIGANLSDAVLAGADLHATQFTQSQMDDEEEATGGAVILETLATCSEEASAVLARADLTGASLTKAMLRNVDLQQADLGGADLRQADLSCATVDGAKMKGANLIRVVAQRLRAGDVDLEGSMLGKADLRGASFVGAVLRHANLDQAIVGPTSLAWADLQGASLRELDIRDELNLIGANLQETTPAASVICADDKPVKCTGVTDHQGEAKQ